MGWRASGQSRAGEEPEPGRDPRLREFAKDGKWNDCPPSAALAGILEAMSGSEWRCAEASRDEMVGLLRQWQAIESWAVAGKLGVLRALVRDDDQPLPGGGYHDDLPEGWTKSLTHQVALALAMPAGSAERLMWLAWDLQARLPGTGALLAAGLLTYAKAKAVYEAFQALSDGDAAQAETLILGELPGKTYAQVQKLAVRAALTVDPESGTRRREDAQRNRCRVQLSREESGAAALSGRELPPDQALAANASVCARAQEYKDSEAFPADPLMDQYRAAAYLDLLNGITAEARIASGQLVTVSTAGSPEESGDAEPSHGHGDSTSGRDRDDRPEPDDGPGSPGEGSPGSSPHSPDGPDGGGATPENPPRLADLVLPLASLLGLAERPGECHGLGPLDPSLCRELAAAAAGSAWTRLCLTVTDPNGIAIGHGCAKPSRKPKTAITGSCPSGPRATTALALPARVNLTITAERLAELAATGPPPGTCSAPHPPRAGTWSLTPADGPGPPGGHGNWCLTLPDGRQLTVQLEPIPTVDCDHRHESKAYQPNDTLRHLVQVRDYECTFPPCSRHARYSDFEHATPYDKGGRTCACNAGARSRACHQVKQSPGWTVTQPKPGWHQWQTPTGRVYVQGPKHYPA